jgi:aspartate aminotransferase
MLKISQRGESMPASPIRKLVPYAEMAKAKGIHVYHLNIGQPDIETPRLMMDAVKNADIKVLEYSHSAGNESYRRRLVSFYAKSGINVNQNQIIITNGGSEAILFGFMACLDEGDEVIVPEPFYANYYGFAVAAGLKVIPVRSEIRSGFALPSLEEFEKRITRRTKAILICNPNNPTGYLYSAEEMEKEFCYTGKHHSSMLLEEVDQNVILIDTISKRYSACGARIGALVTKNQQVLDAVMKFAQARLSPPTFSQILGEAAIDLPDDYFNATRAEYQKRRDILVSRLNNMPGVFCPVPGGAFYAMASLPIDDSDRFCQWLLEEFSYKGSTLMLAPATGFYDTPGCGKKEVRLAYVLNQDDLSAAMDVLEEALKVYPGRIN